MVQVGPDSFLVSRTKQVCYHPDTRLLAPGDDGQAAVWLILFHGMKPTEVRSCSRQRMS